MNDVNLAGCVIIKENKILLLNRKKTSWYELPGGKIDDHETPEVAAIRELKEELGCDVEIVKKIGAKEFEHEGRELNYIWFLAKIKKNQFPRIEEPETFDHFEYISINKLSSCLLSPNMKNLFLELSQGNICLD